MSLAGKVAVVTGASSGIGRATVERLVAEGLKVAAIARRGDRLATLPEGVLRLEADLRDLDGIPGLFARVDAELGPTYALVNNAGIGRNAPLLDGATEDWREMLELNVLALCVCTREASQRMVAAGGGHVIHVGSMSGHRVPPGRGGLYAATKFAVKALTDALRNECKAAGAPIRVGRISPGFVETEFAHNYHRDPEKGEAVYAGMSAIQSADIAGLIWDMLSAPAYVEIHDVLLRPTDQQT